MASTHFEIKIITRGTGQTVIAAATYQSGEKLYSEYSGKWEYPNHTDRIAYADILLPANAPESYHDRSTLWNAVDAAETQKNAQTARRIIIGLPRELSLEQNIELTRSFCQEQFVAKGMVADLAVHDDGQGNPHAHVLLTMRAMDENGKWLPKTKTSYLLDEQGTRVKDRNGKFKRIRQDTVDWNNQENCEKWRHAWEEYQNKALEQAGCSERVDMRSYARQGLDITPQEHMGPAVAALEKKGIPTAVGDRNREIRKVNRLIIAIRRGISKVSGWIREIKNSIHDYETLTDEDTMRNAVPEALTAYVNMRRRERMSLGYYAREKARDADFKDFVRAMNCMMHYNIRTVDRLLLILDATQIELDEIRSQKRQNDQRVRDIDAILKSEQTIRKLEPLMKKFDGMKFQKTRQKFQEDHAEEFKEYRKAKWLLKKLNGDNPVDKKNLLKVKKQLENNTIALLPKLNVLNEQMKALRHLRKCVRKVIPEALPDLDKDGKPVIHDQLESAVNQKELDHMLERAVTNVCALSESIEESQIQLEEQQQTKEPEKVKEDHEAKMGEGHHQEHKADDPKGMR